MEDIYATTFGPPTWYYGGVGDEWEVYSWVGHQVGLELRQVNIECAIKPSV